MPASNTDLAPGFDPTGYTTISGAQLLQLIASAQPYTDKGLVVFTEDLGGIPVIPDANIITKWARYLWIRYSPMTTSVGVYVWNPDRPFFLTYTDGSLTQIQSNWNPIAVSSIPAGSIFGFMIAPGTITKDKIVSVDVSQIEGFNASNFLQLTTVPAAGDISGTYSVGFTVTALAITASKIAAGAVTLAKLDATAGLQDQVLSNSGATDVVWSYVYNLLSTQAAKVTPVAADYVQLLDSADGFAGKKVLLSNLIAASTSIATNRFVSAPVAAVVDGVQLAATNHGLKINGVDTAPQQIGGYLINNNAANAQGYAVGDRVPIHNFTQNDSSRPAYSVGASSTQVWAAARTINNNDIELMHKDGSNSSSITIGDWTFVAVVEL